ncbi:MAG: hypothetical protein J6C46_01240 [Clostridia bacterium]|nr:hypothetical protein [Clostridia bacterium]
MEKRFKKEELIKLIEDLKISKSEFWILSSGALVFRGLFPDAGDLDIAVTEKGLEELKQNFSLTKKANDWYIVNDNVECVVDIKEDWKIEEFEGYNLQSLEKYFDYLSSSTREKDKIRYDIVKKELERRGKI